MGIDIYSSEIRILQLKCHQQELSLEKMALIAVPKGVISHGRIVEPDVLIKLLKEYAKKTETMGSPVNIALPDCFIISKKLKISADLSEIELEAELESNLHDYLPGMESKLFFDFIKQEDGISLIAAREEDVLSYTQVFQSAGYEVVGVDVVSFALSRAINLYQSHSSIALLDLNEMDNKILVIHNKEIIFNHLLSALDNHSELIMQIKQSFKLYASLRPELLPQRLLVSGTQSQNLLEIEKECSLKTEPANPFASMKYSDGIDPYQMPNMAARMLVACGLALRGV
jgi:type IV pilus assembly protein PilM